jgi:4-amino-4-deoxy-L-arabinose transferase-like glycosyltransferase
MSMSTSLVAVRNRPQYVSHLIQALESRNAIYFVIALGVLVRLIPLVLVGGKFLAHENPSYDVMAGQLLRNEHFSAYWPPGLPYYLAFFHALFGPGMLVARVSIIVVYVAFCLVLYRLIEVLKSRRAANLAVLVFAFYPSYVRYAFDPSTEYLTATCLLAIVYCTVLIIRKPSFGPVVLLGLSLGAVALVRPQSVGLAIVVPAYLALQTRRWTVAIVSLLLSALLISAWIWKVSTVTGRFTFINDSNEENFVFSNHPVTPLYLTCRDCPIYGPLPANFLALENEIDHKPPLEQQRQLQQTTVHFILSRPDIFVLRTLNRFRAYFRFPIHYADPLVRHSQAGRSMRRWLGSAITALEVAFFWPLMLLGIVSCFNPPALRIDPRSLFTTLAVVTVAYALPCWLTWSEPRYAFPLIPVFLILCFVLLDSLLVRPWREVLAPVLHSTSRKRLMIGTLAIFFCIQIEWIVLIVSAGAWHDRWAHVSSFPQF